MDSHECLAPNVIKCCTVCGMKKHISEFNKKRIRKDGVQTYFGYCKSCNADKGKAYRAENAEVVKARCAKYRKANKEKIAEWHKAHYQKNRVEILAKQREYNKRDDVKDRESDRQRKRYIANRDQIRSSQNARNATEEGRKKQRERYLMHYKSKKDLYVAKGGDRRAYRVGATPGWYKRGDSRPFFNLAKRLTEETGIKHVVDHIIPLKGKNVCGLHVKENLQVITASENLSKYNNYEG